MRRVNINGRYTVHNN